MYLVERHHINPRRVVDNYCNTNEEQSHVSD